MSGTALRVPTVCTILLASVVGRLAMAQADNKSAAALGSSTAPSAKPKPASNAPAVDLNQELTVENLFVDFLQSAIQGKFKQADALGKALLAHPDLDPVELLNLANRDPVNMDTLQKLIATSSISDTARRVMEVIEKGELLKRKDAERIQSNIDRLGGDPQQEMFGIKYLAQSGEYAVPLIIRTLQDPSKKDLWPRVIMALSQLGKGVVNPMVAALAINNNDIRQNLIHALGELGYAQAVPYLRRYAEDSSATPEVRKAATAAIARIQTISGKPQSGTPDEQFFKLADRYYEEDEVVRADPRVDDANVWYWDTADQRLKPVAVPQRVFGPRMAMRCCEEAIRARGDNADAIALWLAADFRREARLGLNVESGDPAESGESDKTQQATMPRAMYFAQAAGPRYLHLVLERALKDQDSAVALGAIEALRVTAGEASLVGSEDARLSLTRCLQFPDLVVRARAALALGAALPRSQFTDSQFVIPELGRALAQTGSQQVMVVDGDGQNLNRVVGIFHGDGREALGDGNFFNALNRVRKEFQSLSGILVATDISDPNLEAALQALRGEFVYAKTPLVLLVKPGQSVRAEQITKADNLVETVDAAANESALQDAFDRARKRAGKVEVSKEQTMAMALQAADTLRKIVTDGKTVYDATSAESSLIGALGSSEERLAVSSASVLALLHTPTSQRAIAHVAMDGKRSKDFRVSAFHSLAESAKNHGNQLEPPQVDELIKCSLEENDLVIRTAASQALGAVNLKDNKASTIIRNFSAE